ncbi:MAG TPA: amino acid deaminase [Allosphingosinicella sp.]|nr:amino acid deaminase [Allosphingosinicella sp.]
METAALDWRIKGLPAATTALSPAELGALGINLLDGGLMMPAAVIRQAALLNNIAAMQAFADQHGAKLCPHGKTSMSPELFAMQLGAGAWGLTAATAHHVRIYRRLGIRRILLANQLVGRADIAFVLEEIAGSPEFDFYCLADSAEAVDLLAEAAAAARCPRPVQLLVEIGLAGGRTGARTVAGAMAVARRVAAASPLLALRGIETFEGVHQTRPTGQAEAGDMLESAAKLTEAALDEDLFAPGPVILTAGGSAFLDLCTATLPPQLGGRSIERVLRPGCYVTHDNGLYGRLTGGAEARGLPALAHALEVWGVVLSVPEPGLAVVGVGKRDVSSDVEPPIPLWTCRPGRNSRPRPTPEVRVVGLWDQHASLATPHDFLKVGDLVGFGISHPCATFDRWRALLTVDDEYFVTGAVTTLF